MYIELPVRNFGHSAAPRQSISPCHFGGPCFGWKWRRTTEWMPSAPTRTSPRAVSLFSPNLASVKCMFWVSPTRRLYDLFWAIHNMPEQTPAEVVALSAKHEVDFLPPPEEAKANGGAAP